MNLRLGLSDEGSQAGAVAVTGRERQSRQLVHGANVGMAVGFCRFGNSRPVSCDYPRMACAQFREAISARLDGEAPAMPEATLDAHLAACADCARWEAASASLVRVGRVTTADPVADRTPAIIAAAVAQGLLGGDTPYAQRQWRLVLAGLALTQLALALPDLLFGADTPAAVHVTHELGAWDVALAVGFLFAALRPSRAWGMLPLVAALVGCLVVTTAVDVAAGNASAAAEAAHALDLAGLAVLWQLAHRPAASARPRLHLA